jgi:uncharacterized OsmC-like protein
MQTITSTVTNGVNTDALMQTIQAVKAQPELAKFNFRISNRWLGGSHNRSTVNSFTGTMKEVDHLQKFEMDAGEHPVLLGNDEGANPVEYLLHAVVACVTTSTVYHAAGQGIAIESVESTVEGDLDLRGFLGLDPSVRPGYQAIRITMRIKTNADDRQWAKLVKFGPTFSPVFESITNGVPVQLTAERA